MKLIIGNRAYSSWSMRGWLALQHSGLEFEELVVPMFDENWEKRREGDEFAPSLGKVPVLWDGDCVVWDSLAIIDFLADRVGRDLFWPADESARGMARSMAAEMHSGFANLRRDLPMNVRKNYGSVPLSEVRFGSAAACCCAGRGEGTGHRRTSPGSRCSRWPSPPTGQRWRCTAMGSSPPSAAVWRSACGWAF